MTTIITAFFIFEDGKEKIYDVCQPVVSDYILYDEYVGAGYIKFFLQCVIDQCNVYIYKLEKIKEIYKEDMKAIEVIKGNSVYRIMPVIMKQIVFTKKEVQELSGVSVNVVSKIINQLVDLNIIIPDSSIIKKGYRYQKIYEVFVGSKNFV